MTCPYESTCLGHRKPSDNICATCTIREALTKRDFVTVKTTTCYNCTDYHHCLATRVGQCDRTKPIKHDDRFLAGAPISARPFRCKKSDADWVAGKTCEPCDGCEVTP